MASFQNKVYAISGGASRIGLATAQLLASLASLEPSEGNSNSAGHMFAVVDVRDGNSVAQWIRQTVETLGQLDGAVNMAGVIRPARSVVELTDEDWDWTLEVNGKGMLHCLASEIAAMQPGGSIVSAASVFGQRGSPGNAAYAASKAAVISLCQTAAKENPHIRINCVSPGSVNTPMSRGEDPSAVQRGLQSTVMKRRAAPGEIASVIAFLLSNEASIITGAIYNADGGYLC